MNSIIHPKTGKRHSLFSNKGISLLKAYVKQYQSGGGEETSATETKLLTDALNEIVSIDTPITNVTVTPTEVTTNKINLL